MKTVKLARAKGISDLGLVFLLLFIVCVLLGVVVGADFGSSYGTLGKWTGGLAGSIAGVVGAVLTLFVAALIDNIFCRFGRWWRPYPPVCENGICMGWRCYESHEIPENVVHRVKGMSTLGHRCKCGNIYAGGYGYGMQNRWVRVLPNGEIRPYLKHRAFGGWKPDHAVVIGPGRIDRAMDALDRVHIPGWAIPCMMTAIFGSSAFAAIWSKSGFKDSIALMFVVVVAAFGFVAGCFIWWLGPRKV